jgi:hypothetical protein
MVTCKVLVDLYLFQKHGIFAGALLSEDVTGKYSLHHINLSIQVVFMGSSTMGVVKTIESFPYLRNCIMKHIFFILFYVHTMFGSFLHPPPHPLNHPTPPLLPYSLTSRQKLFFPYI